VPCRTTSFGGSAEEREITWKEVNWMEVRFKREKDTKNTVRFQEVEGKGKPPVVGTIYVQKWFAGDRQELTIEIKE
jgi:hypothetical protein